jgi:hypothetical protein
MKNLEEDEKAHVIVCFCEGLTIRKLLKAMQYLNMTSKFIIIGTDGWADRQDVVTDYEEQAIGSISIRIHSPYQKTFDENYLKLDPFENVRNPWFREFWEDKFSCKMPSHRMPITTTTTTTSTTTTSTTMSSSDYFDLNETDSGISLASTQHHQHPLPIHPNVTFCTGKVVNFIFLNNSLTFSVPHYHM